MADKELNKQNSDVKRKKSPASLPPSSSTVVIEAKKQRKGSTVLALPPHTVDNSNTELSPKLDEIPSVPLEKIFSFLLKKEGCADLSNLRKVNHHLKRHVDEFMDRDKNRPLLTTIAIERGGLYRMDGWVNVVASFKIVDLHFLALSSVEWDERIERSRDGEYGRVIYCARIMNPPIGKFRRLLASLPLGPSVEINWWKDGRDLQIVGKIICYSSFRDVIFEYSHKITDKMARKMKKIVSVTKAKYVEVICRESQITNPYRFVTALDALATEGVSLVEKRRWMRSQPDSFFGVTLHFWHQFLTQKMARPGGHAYCNEESLTAPIHLPDAIDMKSIEWN